MEYFFETPEQYSKAESNSYEGIRAYLEKIYNKADDQYHLRFENKSNADEHEQKFDDLKKNVILKETHIKDVEKNTAELERLKLLTLGNIWLKKGQYLDETFQVSHECYETAANLLWQTFVYSKNDDYTCDSLLIRLNLGKYFRNKGNQGWNNKYYGSAKDEFKYIIDTIQDHIFYSAENKAERWEIHLWLEAKVNIDRIRRREYHLEEARISLWKLFKNLLFRLQDEKDISKNDDPEPNDKCLFKRKEIEDRLINDTDIQLKTDFENAKEDNEYVKILESCKDPTIQKIYKEYLLQTSIHLAITYRREQAYKKAQAICDLILKYMDPDNIDAKNEQSVCQRKTGKIEEALERFIETKGSENRFAKVNIWKCKLKTNELDVEELNAVLDKNPDDFEVLQIRGQYYKYKEIWKNASDDFDRIYNTMPFINRGTKGLKAYYNFATVLLKQDKVSQAKKNLEKITTNYPNDIPARIDLGWCHMKLQDYETALKIYENLIKRETILKNFAEMKLYNNCGECYLRRGKWKEAEKKFMYVLSKEPNNAEANYFMAKRFIMEANETGGDADKYEKAFNKLQDAVRAKPQESRFISGLAIAKMKYPVNSDQVHKDIKRSLMYIQGPYSLKACIEFASFIEKQNNMTKQLYEAFSRIELGRDEEGYYAFRHLQEKTAFQRLDAEVKGKVLVKLYKIYEHVVRIKDICRYMDNTSKDQVFVHYTKLDTLKKLQTKKENTIPKMRLWNSVYMNDPFEGERFIELLKKVLSEGDIQNTDEILKKYFLHLHNEDYKKMSEMNERPNLMPVNSNVYITSFSKCEDDIQMWVQYADEAKGCNITFDDSFFDKRGNPNELDDVSIYTDRDYPLYEVQYIDMEDIKNINDIKDMNDTDIENMNNIDEHKKFLIILTSIKNIWKHLKALDEYLGESLKNEDGNPDDFTEVKQVIRSFVTNRLNEVRFLFKDKEYAHEKEYRLVQYYSKPKIDEENFKIPRLYIEVNKDIQIKEVMLGPKVSREEANEIVSWLHAAGHVEKVTRSNRHYK